VIASVNCRPASLNAVMIPERHSRLNLIMPYEPVDQKRDVHERMFCTGPSHVFNLTVLLSNLLTYKRYIYQRQ
jgi:hypothetical protein